MTKMDFIKALKNGVAYDFICNNYYDMSRMELADILKEYIYYVGESYSKEEVEELVIDELESQIY